jgi:hypothetical protein
MAVFLSAFGVFAIAFAIHLIWWRLRVPRRQAAVLSALFLSVAIAGFGTIAIGNPFPGEMPVPRILLSVLLFFSFSAAYLILFSALEADSPTLTVIGLIAERGSRGIHRQEVISIMQRHSYVKLRIEQMVTDGMVVEMPNGLRLASQGLWLTSIVLFYRTMLGRKHVGG